MSEVVSLGSVNVDLVSRLNETEIDVLSDQYDWFPAPDETVAVSGIPPSLDDLIDATHIGGKGANQAVAAANAGAKTRFCGRVGPDEGDFDVLSSLRGRGVDVNTVEGAPVETGKAYVFVDDVGETHIAIVEGANGAVDTDYVDRHRGEILNADCLLLQNEIPMETMVELLDSLTEVDDRPLVIFDPAPPVGAAPLLRSSAVDIITPNAYEYEHLRDDIETFDGSIIQKRGPKPVIVEAPGNAPIRLQPPRVTPVDTTGAGDVFNGYLVAQLSGGTSLIRAVELATAAASLAITEEGAQRAIPTLPVVKDFLS